MQVVGFFFFNFSVAYKQVAALCEAVISSNDDWTNERNGSAPALNSEKFGGAEHFTNYFSFTKKYC